MHILLKNSLVKLSLFVFLFRSIFPDLFEVLECFCCFVQEKEGKKRMPEVTSDYSTVSTVL